MYRCTFCGAATIPMLQIFPKTKFFQGKYRICCRSCGYATPWVDSKEEALNQWKKTNRTIISLYEMDQEGDL